MTVRITEAKLDPGRAFRELEVRGPEALPSSSGAFGRTAGPAAR